MIIIGIDPGASGGITVLDMAGEVLDRAPLAKMTNHDIAEALREWRDRDEKARAVIERVGPARGRDGRTQGISSTAKFMRQAGMLEGFLIMGQIPYGDVAPAVWQRALGCLSKGDKNVTKAAAQRRWPDLKWTHALADSALIAEYERQRVAAITA